MHRASVCVCCLYLNNAQFERGSVLSDFIPIVRRCGDDCTEQLKVITPPKTRPDTHRGLTLGARVILSTVHDYSDGHRAEQTAAYTITTTTTTNTTTTTAATNYYIASLKMLLRL